MNCGTACHNPRGLASDTGFYMRLDVAKLGSVAATDTYTTGWNVPDKFAIPGAAAGFRFHACDLVESAAYYRDSHRDGQNGTPAFTQMPPIDSHMVDFGGIASVAAWILQWCD